MEREDALENAVLAARVEFKGEQLPLRTAQAQLAVLADYGDRDELGRLANDVSAGFNEERLDVLRAGERLEADVSGIDDAVERNEEEKGISLRELEGALAAANEAVTDVYDRLKDRWLERLLGPEREQVPSSSHIAYLRRLSPLEAIYTKEQAVPVCMDTLARLGFDLENEPNIKLDLDDRPQKSPRACVIPADPPKIVHLITRAQGGLHDYQAFLHEAGHALHYAGCDPSLPYTFRNISRDHALTEIYSYIVEAISRRPGWHARYFDLSDEEAAALREAMVGELGRVLDVYEEKVAMPLPEKFPKPTRVHAHQGEPCPRCEGVLEAVFYEDYVMTYCPACQTDGRVLKDRRLSRLLK